MVGKIGEVGVMGEKYLFTDQRGFRVNEAVIKPEKLAILRLINST